MKSSHAFRWMVGISGSVLLAIGATAGIKYHQDLRAYQQRIAGMGSQVVETNCGTIEYAQAGSGYPVLVVHGNGGGFDQGLGLAHTYLGKGFQVIAPSRFGYLRSPVPVDATVEMQADAYACLLDKLHIDRAALLTTSAGVTSSLQFAMRHPDRVSALVLHSPNAPGKVDMQLPPRQVFSAMFHSDFAFWTLMTCFRPAMRSFVGIPKGFVLTKEMESYAAQALMSVLPASARADGMVFDTFVSNPEINQYTFEMIQAPTIIISAVDDPMALHENARALAERIPGARLVVVENGGHLMLGHDGAVKEEINRFLGRAVALGIDEDNLLKVK